MKPDAQRAQSAPPAHAHHSAQRKPLNDLRLGGLGVTGADLTEIGISTTKAPDAPVSRQILTPFNPREAISTTQAAERAGKSVGTIRFWCDKHGIGRKICGEMHISRPALEMLLESDYEALRRYHSGDRQSEQVRRYLELFGL